VGDSIWKKEISFKRKPKQESDPDEFELPKQSVWKKEISLSRKPKVEAAKPEADGSDPGEPVRTPWYKKELGAPKKPPKQAKAPKEPKAESASVPWWKREVTIGKPRAAKQEKDVERLVEQAVQAVAPPPQPVVAPAPIEPEVLPVADEPVVPAPVAPTPAAPAVETIFTAAIEPLPEPPPVEVPVPTAAAPAPAPVETWEAPPQVPGPEPVVVHPPVPADELPALPEEPKAEKPVPFWKKEVTIGKPREPKAAKAPKEPKPAKAESGDKPAPFWKRELTVGKPKTPKAEKPAKVKAPSQPFWKSMSFSLPSGGGGRGGKRSSGKSAKRLVGLKIGASQIAAARVNNNGTAELVQVARQPLSPGVVVSGELRDPDTLAEELKEFFTRNKLPKRNVRLGIASNRIGVRTFDIDGIQDDKALTNAIQFRAQETLPIPIEEAVLDYQVLSEAVDDEGQPRRKILLVVAYRELVDRYVSACRKAGISLVGIDLEAFALLRALGAPRPADEPANAAVGAVTIGHERSTFAVSDGRVCEFTRVLEWGGSMLNVAIARALDVAPSEVEGVKRALSLDGGAAPAGLTAEQAAAALDATRKQLQAFARELVSSLQFYQNQPGSLGIGEIVVTGGTAHLPGLAAELQRLIGVHVRVGDPLARMKVSKRIGEEEQLGSYAVAIGLGIED
jgi:type IV pilus assembly protein PilM